MNKMIKALAVAMTVLCTLVVASPANAYVTPVARLSQAVNTPTPLHVDNAVVFAKQADGTGVTVNWTAYSVNNCTQILSPKWYDVHIRIYDGNTGVYVNGVDYGSTSTCSPTWTVNKNGLDNGYVTVVVMAAATRAANNAQYWFEYKWALYPSGNTVLLYSGIVNY